ncbi:MAG: DUF5672 family protein [Pseudomonadota bacterium]|nr:DUF5672 family protein [Pseudomonadota bacterium]
MLVIFTLLMLNSPVLGSPKLVKPSHPVIVLKKTNLQNSRVTKHDKTNKKLITQSIISSPIRLHGLTYTKEKITDNNIAMIIEPRQHPLLEPVIRNCYEHLGWPIILFHGTKNLEYINSSPYLVKLKDQGMLILKNLEKENLTSQEYSTIMISESFWKEIPAENILVFQTDVVICGNNETLKPFLQYDYVGAPWAPTIPSWIGPNVGNGGLSFRKKSAMLKATQAIENKNIDIGNNQHNNEDAIFAHLGEEYNKYLFQNNLKEKFVDLKKQKNVILPKTIEELELLNIPNAETAGTFSAELFFNSPHPFGVHAINKRYKLADLSQEFIDYCPDIRMIYPDLRVMPKSPIVIRQ